MIKVTIRRPSQVDHHVELASKPNRPVWAQENGSTLILTITGDDVARVRTKIIGLPGVASYADTRTLVYTGDHAAFVLNNFWN
jgi:hypothetical protein